ncbi:MAG: NAD-dependent protein deacylase sirtuin-5, mitochondrial [Candidatus Celerinatantimonas neptuna]|nr:MAG: NAD-dependent protein deacylase sirtuin-5, mitochondrial [Candidatus Celerinatantimonas neptuna]
MKLVIFSGAGLSMPSGIPGYERLKETPIYDAISQADDPTFLSLVKSTYEQYSDCQPNKAHNECKQLEKYCEILGIDYVHYTLNVDTLLEQAGADVEHLYGCMNDPESLVCRRHFPAESFINMQWDPGDILLVLGVSDSGAPLAFIENKVSEAGAVFKNYNIAPNPGLQTQTIMGNIVETFSAVDALSIVFSEFDIVDAGFAEFQVREFLIRDRRYETYFSPAKDTYTDLVEQQFIEKLVHHPLDQLVYEVKFDLSENRENETIFARPHNNFDLEALNALGIVLAASVKAHQKLSGGEIYTATAADIGLVRFYNRLAKKYANQLNYDQWCGEGNEGLFYAFKKR